MKFTFIAALLAISLLSACQHENSDSGTGQAAPEEIGLELLHPNIRILYEDMSQYISCETPKACGSIIRLTCSPEVDGPDNYYDNFTGESIMYCGGGCMAPNPDDPKACKDCPPAEWECSYY